MIREHRAVVAARLSPWRVITDRRRVESPDVPAPWVVLDFPPPLLESDRWEGPAMGRSLSWFQTACVGEDADQAGVLHDRVVERLLDWVPVVDGWPSVWPVGMDTNPRLIPPDDSVPGRRLVEVVTRWSWHAERSV